MQHILSNLRDQDQNPPLRNCHNVRYTSAFGLRNALPAARTQKEQESRLILSYAYRHMHERMSHDSCYICCMLQVLHKWRWQCLLLLPWNQWNDIYLITIRTYFCAVLELFVNGTSAFSVL